MTRITPKIREEVLRAIEGGVPVHVVAQTYRLAETTVRTMAKLAGLVV